MLKITAAIHFYGKNFFPNKVEEEFGLKFTEKSEKGDLSYNGKWTEKVGSCKIEAPAEVEHFERILWLCRQIDRKTIRILKKAGATHIYFWIGYFYYKQCNCSLSTQELQAISGLKIPYLFSCYSCKKKEFEEIK